MDSLYQVGIVFNYISSFALFFPVILGIMKIRALDHRALTFFVFISYDLLSSWVAYFARYSGNNLYLFHVNAVINLILLTVVFFPNSSRKSIKQILWSVFGFIIVLALYEAFLTEKSLTYYNSLTSTVSAGFIIALCFVELIKQRKDEFILDISKEPFFWFTISVAIFYAANIVTYAFQKTFQDISTEALVTLSIIQQSAHILAIIGFILGFSLIISPRKASS